MNDETLKEEIDTWIRQAYVNGSLDVNNPEPQGSDVCTELVWEAVLKDRERAVKNAYNNARYTLHSILSNDVDSELDHSDIEAKFMAQLSNPTQENTTVYNIAGGDEYKIMGEKVTGVNTLTVHDLDKPNQAQEKESDE